MLGEIRGEVRFKEPLSFHTSLRIGGAADIFVVPQDVEDIRLALSFAEREQLPVEVIGGGNNLLASDRGFRGVVLKLEGCLGRAEFHGEEAVAGAGVSLSGADPRGGGPQPGRHRVPRRHPRDDRRRGGDECGHARRLDRGLRLRRLLPPSRRHPRRVQAGRRLVQLPRVLGARPAPCSSARGSVCTGGPHAEIQKEIKQRLKQKKTTQPLALASAGCVWKNPPGEAAGRLIEKVGLKGKRLQRRRDLGQARQLHRQPRRRHRRRHQGADGHDARARPEPVRHHARARDQDPRGDLMA